LQEEVDISNCENAQEVYDGITKRACDGVRRVVEEVEEKEIIASL
jgi:hypothetical protein